MAKDKTFNDTIKRIFDIEAAALALVLLSPVLFVIAIIILIKMGKPVLFIQTRPGLDAKPFKMHKFRTMTYDRNEKGELILDTKRITKLGAFLRKTSIDELPGLWNVLKGDMSLVGPRALLTEYLQHYSDFQRRRHEVKPGITGWAQINGRHILLFSKRLELDVWYADNWNLILDLKILYLTIYKIHYSKERIPGTVDDVGLSKSIIENKSEFNNGNHYTKT